LRSADLTLYASFHAVSVDPAHGAARETEVLTKSVACSRLNGHRVSAFFFLPVLVAALTRADEFIPVTKTRCPSALSHFARSASCVVFPDSVDPLDGREFARVLVRLREIVQHRVVVDSPAARPTRYVAVCP